MTAHAIFFYGSLRDRALLQIVLDRPVDPAHLEPAVAEGFATLRLADEAYPMMLPAAGQQADGVLFHGATDADLDRLAFFEEAEYGLAPIAVTTGNGRRDARYFRGTDKPVASTEDWDFDDWCRDHRTVAIEATREYMHYYGRLPVEEVDRLWHGIMIRAYQRARALTSEPRLGGLRTDFNATDVELLAQDRSYTSFLAVQELRLRHRRFDGDWTGELNRSIVAWGDAVTVLPYDPKRDRLLLIEQFRCGPFARGDRNPWCVEVIAGRIDAAEDAARTARREAVEEAGVTLGRLAEVAEYYLTPGLACEHMTAYVGEADLASPGGIHGLASEGEDIRAMVLNFDEAMEAVKAGAVNTSYTLISLLWLAANRQRLREEWG